MLRPRHLVLVPLLTLLGGVLPSGAGARAELDRTFLRDGTHKFAVETDRAHAVIVLGRRIFATGDDGGVLSVTDSGREDPAYGVTPPVGAPGVPAAFESTERYGLPGGLIADPRPGDPRAVVTAAVLGQSGVAITRLHGDGSVDTGWGPGGALFYGGAFVYAAANILADPVHPGRTFVGALRVTQPYCSDVCGEYDVARLDERGRLDLSWGEGGVVRFVPPAGTGIAATLSTRRDGGLAVLLTHGYSPAGRDAASLVRISAAGKADAAVTVAITGESTSAVPDGDGGFFVFARYGPGGLTHLLDDGARDAALVDVALPGLSVVTGVVPTRDGLVVIGSVRRGITNTPRLLRLDAHARPDPRFGRRGLLTLSFRKVRIAQELAAGIEDADGRLVLAGSVGDLLTDIREDYGPTHLGLMRVRTRPPDLDLAAPAVRTGARGAARVRLRCGVHPCRAGLVDVRRGDRVLGRARVPALKTGRRLTVTVRLGAVGGRLAAQRAAVDVRVRAGHDPARPQETDPVLRAARLVPVS